MRLIQTWRDNFCAESKNLSQQLLLMIKRKKADQVEIILNSGADINKAITKVLNQLVQKFS